MLDKKSDENGKRYGGASLHESRDIAKRDFVIRAR